MKNTNVILGLTANQSRILFSLEKYLVERDIAASRDAVKTAKENWLKEWEKSIINYLKKIDQNADTLLNVWEIHEQIKLEKELNPNNFTWYYLVLLEAALFNAYTPLDKNVKKYRGLRYKKQTEILKAFVMMDNIANPEFIDRVEKGYTKAINKISGKDKNIIITVLTTIAVAAAAAALAAVFAGPIAVAIVGSEFTGLYGAALTNASLALLGGGAIAAGGAGMAGGVAVIVGGGSLLGIATGGAIGAAGYAFLSTPEFIISESAKLEVVIKEILLNAQQDILSAQEVLRAYQEKIKEMENHITELELKNEKNKKEISKMRKSIEYMKKAYKESGVFLSAYQVGDSVEKANK